MIVSTHSQPDLTEDPYLSLAEAMALYDAGDAAHDFDHVLRVTRLGMRIAQAEGANARLVRIAALMHDAPVAVGNGSDHRPDSGMDRVAHHHAAAEFARAWLAGRGMAPGDVANVAHCIQAHRYRDRSIEPQTPEAKCLYDADKLDSIGAIGVTRAFAFGGAHGARLWSGPWPSIGEPAPQGVDYTPVHEFVYKLRHVAATLHTPAARRMAQARHAYMVAFFERLDAEMQGEA